MSSRHEAEQASPTAATPLGRLAEKSRWRYAADAPSLLSAPNVADAMRHFKALTRGATRRVGDTLSAQERRRSHFSEQDYYYGEILFESLAVLLHRIKTVHGGLAGQDTTMVDLGSGLGPLGCSRADPLLVAPPAPQILSSLHAKAEDLAVFTAEQMSHVPPPHGRIPTLLLHQGDFLDVAAFDWTGCDLAVATSTFYTDETMTELANLCDRMHPGSFVITATKALPSSQWEALEEDTYSTSWGSATLFLQRRKPR